jgi:hypothetical protein
MQIKNVRACAVRIRAAAQGEHSTSADCTPVFAAASAASTEYVVGLLGLTRDVREAREAAPREDSAALVQRVLAMRLGHEAAVSAHPDGDGPFGEADVGSDRCHARGGPERGRGSLRGRAPGDCITHAHMHAARSHSRTARVLPPRATSCSSYACGGPCTSTA